MAPTSRRAAKAAATPAASDKTKASKSRSERISKAPPALAETIEKPRKHAVRKTTETVSESPPVKRTPKAAKLATTDGEIRKRASKADATAEVAPTSVRDAKGVRKASVSNGASAKSSKVATAKASTAAAKARKEENARITSSLTPHRRSPLMRPATPPIPIEPPKPSLEQRSQAVELRLHAQPKEIQDEYEQRLLMSWVYHDSALEGVMYTLQELTLAIGPATDTPLDPSIQPICDEIRRHKAAIDYVREVATTKKRQPLTTDMIKKIYLLLHPEEGDLKTVKYRKEIPQHRLYAHEYVAPDKIAYAVRQVVDWVNDPDTKRTRSIVRMASRAHYDLLRAFPFPQDSGKVSRLLMNLLLLREDYPPAIIHSTERQRYYEALKGAPLAIVHMVEEALENSVASVEKYLDERTTRVRSFVS